MKSKTAVLYFSALMLVVMGSVMMIDDAEAQFIDVTAGSGIVPIPQGDDAAAAVDFDNDGDLDISILHGRGSGIGLRLYENDGTGQFSDITPSTGVGSTEGKMLSWADFDSDGDQDFAVVVDIPASLLLFRNTLIETGLLTFTQVLMLPGSWRLPSWVDFDSDGDLDLYLGGELQPNSMFRSNQAETGLATFTDVTASVGLARPTDFGPQEIAWGDADNDGDMDLYLTNGSGARCCPGSDSFYRNNLTETGIASFMEITTGVGLDTSPTYSFSGTWADYDDDNDLDLYVGFGQFTPNRLFRNNFTETGSLSFTEIGGASNSQRPTDGGTASWSDFDNDGDMDLLANGVSNEPWVLHRNLLREAASPTFTEVTGLEGLPSLSHVRGALFFDMDNDLDMDLLVIRVKPPGGFSLFQNIGQGGSSLQVLLEGTDSNRDGTGARIVLTAAGQQQSRDAYRHVTHDGSGGFQEVRRIHFGLGNATTVDELEVHWPSGCVQRLLNLEANHFVRVVERCSISVAIDIKPDSFSNSINPKSKGVTPVAILSTRTLEITDVDLATVLFGATGTETGPVRSTLEDVDEDGNVDLILHFNTQDTGINCGDTAAFLTGRTFGGQVIEGSDSINTVGCK